MNQKDTIAIIQNCFRESNPILKMTNDIFLLDTDISFKTSPFLNYRSLFLQYKSNIIDAFRKVLIEKNYNVRIITEIEVKDLKCQGFFSDKTIYGDHFSASHENELLSRLNIQYFYHLNYLLNDINISDLPEKFSFSKFRKLFENRVIKTDYSLSHAVMDSSFMFYDYIKQKGPLTYFATRNYLTGKSQSTRLSHNLNLGQISPKEVFFLINNFERENGNNKSTYWIKFELLWREYFYWLYQKHELDFFRSKGLDGGSLKLKPLNIDQYLSKTNTSRILQAMNNELTTTGFLSNRLRQIYVSEFIHETDLDWRYGAWFFQHNLIDYDIYSNWGNWIYGAGVGTDSKGPRKFNIKKQLKTYDPEGQYLSKWLKRKIPTRNILLNKKTILKK